VPDAALVQRLAAHRTLGSAPREQLEWLASRGKLQRFEGGSTPWPATREVDSLMVILSGRLSIYVDRGGGPRRVMEWRGGDVSGFLPYSRMGGAPGDVKFEETTEVLSVPKDCFPEMVTKCPDITASLVHVMLDRARRFTSSDLQDEKMLSLGRLAAGLAHELNNPASAVARSARELSARLFEVEATALALGSVGLSREQLDVVARVRTDCCEPGAAAKLTPIERADREEAATEWLAKRGLPAHVADALAETPIPIGHLEQLGAALDPEALATALHSIGAGHRARVLASEVEAAARRIHSLVAAIKGFTYMDQSNVPTPVDIGQGLRDTVAVLGGKAHGKSVEVTVRVADDLPTVHGFGGELNQVWSNLIDNAIDAVPSGGHVEVTAARQGTGVAIAVVDDGPGIPQERVDRIFEPFFTTKPQGQGTGLGLDIARRLVQEHEGRIEVDSRPGRTEFRVFLPGA
jgi:signal transduction histidine kinase